MAKEPHGSTDKDEVRPDAWPRFERAVDAAVKSGPKHRAQKSDKTAGKPKLSKDRPKS
jgi:hypothetical protein